jgi:hypothetical protein
MTSKFDNAPYIVTVCPCIAAGTASSANKAEALKIAFLAAAIEPGHIRLLIVQSP